MTGQQQGLSAEEREALWPIFNAVTEATATDWTGHLPNCGYTAETPDCACSAWGGRLRDALSPFAKRLAERDALAGKVAAVRALDLSCEEYDAPGQDCITAGPEVFAVEACAPCRIRAALGSTDAAGADS